MRLVVNRSVLQRWNTRAHFLYTKTISHMCTNFMSRTLLRIGKQRYEHDTNMAKTEIVIYYK